MAVLLCLTATVECGGGVASACSTLIYPSTWLILYRDRVTAWGVALAQNTTDRVPDADRPRARRGRSPV